MVFNSSANPEELDGQADGQSVAVHFVTVELLEQMKDRVWLARVTNKRNPDGDSASTLAIPLLESPSWLNSRKCRSPTAAFSPGPFSHNRDVLLWPSVCMAKRSG